MTKDYKEMSFPLLHKLYHNGELDQKGAQEKWRRDEERLAKGQSAECKICK